MSCRVPSGTAAIAFGRLQDAKPAPPWMAVAFEVAIVGWRAAHRQALTLSGCLQSAAYPGARVRINTAMAMHCPIMAPVSQQFVSGRGAVLATAAGRP